MFEPGEVVYAFVKNIHPPKNKYFVTIYQVYELRIVTCFTTTQNRVGVPLEQLSNGYVKKNNLLVGYLFDKNIEVGLDPEGVPSKFPHNCVIPFDYGVQIGTKSQFLKSIDKEKGVCKLHPKEYVDLVYTMYKSPMTDSKYKPYLGPATNLPVIHPQRAVSSLTKYFECESNDFETDSSQLERVVNPALFSCVYSLKLVGNFVVIPHDSVLLHKKPSFTSLIFYDTNSFVWVEVSPAICMDFCMG